MFRTRETRLSRGCAISYHSVMYAMCDSDGVLLEVPDGTSLDVHVDVVSGELYVERGGRRYACVPLARRERPGMIGAADRRELQLLLGEMRAGRAPGRG